MEIYVIHCCICVLAETPIKSWNSLAAVRSQRVEMRTERRMAPMGSMYHFSFEPPTEVSRPKKLIKRSLRWSDQRMWICE